MVWMTETQAVATAQTDAALIQGTRRGDAEAFGELARRFQGRVHSMCLRMSGDPAVAEALTEQVFLDAYRDAALLEAPLQSWLLVRTIEACQSPPDTATPVHDEEPDTETEEEVQAHQLQALLNNLTPSFRSAVILRDVLELEYDQIADIMNLPIGTVRSRIHRARIDMASALPSPPAKKKAQKKRQEKKS